MHGCAYQRATVEAVLAVEDDVEASREGIIDIVHDCAELILDVVIDWVDTVPFQLA